MVLIEAMATELPIITTECGREAVSDNNYIVSAENSFLLSEKWSLFTIWISQIEYNWEYQIEIMLNDLILILYAVNGKTYTVVKFNFLLTKLHPLLHCCVNGLLRYSIQEISEIISFTELLLFLCRLEAKVSFVAIVWYRCY